MKTLTAIVDKKFCRIDREKKLYFCFDFDDVEPVYRYMIVMRFAKAYLFSLSRNNYFKILPLSAQRGLKQPPKKWPPKQNPPDQYENMFKGHSSMRHFRGHLAVKKRIFYRETIFFCFPYSVVMWSVTNQCRVVLVICENKKKRLESIHIVVIIFRSYTSYTPK